jgi:iron complex transport system substrate-binding protein
MKSLKIGMLFTLLILGCNEAKNGSEKTETIGKASEPASPRLFWNIENRDGKEYLTDQESNAVEIRVYRRIVVLSPGAVETLYLIGGEASIAGIAASRDGIYPEEKTALLPSVGNAARPNLESVIALNPDLVIGNAMNSGFIQDIKQQGYSGILHGAESAADIFNATLLLGRLTDSDTAARSLVTEKESILSNLKETLASDPVNLKGAFLYSASPLTAFTADSLAGEVLSILGAENIAANLSAAQPILSAEYILAQNPDFLFGAMSITKPEDILTADSVIAQTRAGREGNISIVPSSLFLRPSPRLVDSLLVLHKELERYRNGKN